MHESSSQPNQMSATPKQIRLHHLDWLRVLAMMSVFLFHSDKFFAIEDWHVKNSAVSLASQVHISFFSQWMMPLFFILSGASIYYALQVRSAGQFVRERALRILLPLVGIGWFILSPPQIYLDRLTHGQFEGTFFQFYPHYFTGFDAFGGNFAWHGVHLWYLLYLFVLSLSLLPLFLHRRVTGQSLISRAAPFFERSWALLLLAIPLAGMDILVDALGMGFARATGGWSFFSYLLFLPFGYLFFCTPRMQETVSRFTFFTLTLAVALSGFGLITQHVWHLEIPYGSLAYYIGMLVRSTSSLCWILAILGLGQRFLNFTNPSLRYANEAVLPFYILHQFVILIVGYYVIRWDLGIGAKYAIVVVLSFASIMGLYELLIRQFNVLRFLFGMRLKKGAIE